ncbi:MAG: hypothetical protein R3E66_23635 [bacterium]
MVGIFEVLLPVLVPPTCGIETLEQRSSTLPISSIADVEEPLLRNELITHNYWRIAQRFYERFGDENLVANL